MIIFHNVSLSEMTFCFFSSLLISVKREYIHRTNTFVLFVSSFSSLSLSLSFFVLQLDPKTGKKNSLVSLISLKIYKKTKKKRAKELMEMRLIEWNNDYTS